MYVGKRAARYGPVPPFSLISIVEIHLRQSQDPGCLEKQLNREKASFHIRDFEGV